MEKDLKERFISSNPEHISDKKVCYITYAYLLSVSNFDTDKDLRYVTDRDIANLRVKRNMAYSTFRAKINYLGKLGLVKEDKDRTYLLDPSLFFKAEPETISFLSDASNDRVIRIYIYLGTRLRLFSENGHIKRGHSLHISLDTICESIGLSPNRYSRSIVRNQLLALQRFNLIEFENTKQLSKVTLKEYECDTIINIVKVNKSHKQPL